jgi:F-type H+-transporting ATPase subunit delta
VSSAKVARRYAQALLDLAADQEQLEKWGAELERLAQIVASPELLSRLTSPELPDVVVARHGRLADIAAISQAYRDLVDRHLGRARATVTFAAEPTDADRASVVEALERLSGKKIIAQVNVDPRLIGGVVAELEGRTYDASLATRLELLQQQLSR